VTRGSRRAANVARASLSAGAGIALHEQQVGDLAGRDRALSLVVPEVAGALDGGELQDARRRDAGRDVRLELALEREPGRVVGPGSSAVRGSFMSATIPRTGSLARSSFPSRSPSAVKRNGVRVSSRSPMTKLSISWLMCVTSS
jgi:hypothetical protein